MTRFNELLSFRRVFGVVGVVFAAALMGCGSGTGSDTSSSSAGTTTTAETIGTVDVSGQPGVSAQSVTLDRSVHADINTLAADEGAVLDFEPTDSTTISISLPQAPNAAGVPVKLKVNGEVPAAADRSYAIYVYMPADAEDDGGESLNTLDSTYDEEANTVEAVLPDWAFVPVGNRYIARVKIGLVRTYDPAAVAGTRTAASADRKRPLAVSSLPTGLQLECPLGECVETSQFNPRRELDGRVRPHKGNDFRAAEGTSLYVGAGATLIRGWTPAKFAALGKPKGQGVSLFFDYGAGLPRVAYFHLSSIDSTFVDAVDAKKLAKVTTTVRTLVGQTGATGTKNAHLHMEVLLPAAKTCRQKGKGAAKTTVCPVSYVQTNPMNYLINSFLVDKPSTLSVGVSTTFAIKALDKSGNLIRSEVGHAVETLSGDPTRKLCFRDSAQLIDWQTSGRSWTDTSQEPSLFCTEWQSTITATKRAAGITTVEARYSTAVTTSVYDTMGSPVDSRLFGEDFTKVSADGKDLPSDSATWACVRHNDTGLMWEAHVRRLTGGANGPYVTHPCSWSSSETCTGFSNLGNMNPWDASYEESLQKSTVKCGRSGWRLPTEQEGRALVSHKAWSANPVAAYTKWFGAGVDDQEAVAWTSTLNNARPESDPFPCCAWYINFSVGTVSSSSRGNLFDTPTNNGMGVRLVAP